MKKLKLGLLFLFLILGFSGCATEPIYVAPGPAAGMPGVYHRVERGQTLWQISRLYDVRLEDLINTNHISDVTNIEIGQRIFIPHARPRRTFPVSGSAEDFLWPVKGTVVSAFGQVSGDLVNKGINIRIQDDQAIVASRSGRVVFYNADLKGFGRTVIIDHGDGFSTVYALLDESLVKPGDAVQRGGPVARSRNLHFEIRKGYVSQNPYFYLPR